MTMMMMMILPMDIEPKTMLKKGAIWSNNQLFCPQGALLLLGLGPVSALRL